MGPTRGVATAALGGVALWATLPPRGWWPLGPVAVALLASALRVQRGRGRLVAGMAFGVGWFVPALAWMWTFSAPGAVLAVVLESAILAAAAVAIPGGHGRLVALPGVLVLAEALRGRWPLGGLPLAGPALGQVDGPLLPVAAVGGPLLVVGLVAVAGVALAAVTQRRWVLPAAVTVLAIPALALAVPAAAVASIDSLRVAVVQGGGPRGIPAVVADQTAVMDRQLAATADVVAPVDLVLWPEAAVDVDGPANHAAAGRRIGALARRLSTTLVAGLVEDAGPGRFRNAAVAWDGDGSLVARYDKVHRVPFGEYVPLRPLLDRVVDLSPVPRDAVPGRGPGLMVTPAGNLGVVISFEVFFSDRARAAVDAGGELLLVPTNAASFTGAAVPAQEVAAARLRAVETGRAVLQAAPTGLSAIVAPDGRVLALSDLERPAVLQHDVPMGAGVTPYVAGGDLPVLTTSAITVAVGWVASCARARSQRLARPLAARASL